MTDSKQFIGYPSREPNLDVLPGFVSPPVGYGNVPFYWWVGDKLTKERLMWQLEKLAGSGVTGLQVNYAHTDKGGNSYGLTMPSDPPLFSDEWWKLFKWWAAECNKRGISVSLSDYTLGIVGQGFWMDEILAENSEMHGSVLECIQRDVTGGGNLEITLPENVLCAKAYSSNSVNEIDLGKSVSGNTLHWQAPTGNWHVVIVYVKPVMASVDPINPRLGPLVIEKFFDRFEKALPGQAGKGLDFFFSDELTFGVGGKLWNKKFADEFKSRKGYDILPLLPALFTDVGDKTPKVRLDYYDLVVSLSEEAYFIPVYNWHADRGMIYGCDHGGRGTDVVEFGDYFRTQRWMTGPGCDSPALSSNVVKNKVAASIAHLYERPRVWLEGFHSSGWGTSTENISKCLAENYVMGHNLLSLHGLYYTTHGGWWEWAPPCNHFRMPYWQHMKDFGKFNQRLSYLMSQGVHRCDVAILYPVASMETGEDGSKSVECAFRLGEQLFDHGIDFDYMDFQSLERADFKDGDMRIAGEAYQVLILPAMKTVRYSTLIKALEFIKAGGTVISIGELPEASEKSGRNDAELSALVKEIFSSDNGEFVQDNNQAEETIKSLVKRDFISPVNCKVNHRKIGPRDVYMITDAPVGTVCSFRSMGKVELWDPWTGKSTKLAAISVKDEWTTLAVPVGSDECKLIVFSPGKCDISKAVKSVSTAKTIELNGEWEFKLVPTMDNRWGDFRLPETNGMIGAEARRFAYCLETEPDSIKQLPEYDDSSWKKVTCGFGPEFLKLGPFPAGADTSALENELASCKADPSQVAIDGKEYKWQEYGYSLREGVEGDPGHEGYHGLKESVSDDFIVLGTRKDTWTDTYYVKESDDAGCYYLWTTVISPDNAEAEIISGGIKPSAVWINGKKTDAKSVNLSAGSSVLLLRYDEIGRGHFVLRAKGAPAAVKYPLSMNWYQMPGVLKYDPYPVESSGWYRFTSPPGLKGMSLKAFGDLQVWADGIQLKPKRVRNCDDGSVEYKVTIPDPNKHAAKVAIRIQHKQGYYAGTAIPEPITLDCGSGLISTGDWSQMGVLEQYSRGARYRREFEFSEESSRVVLDLGKVVSSAEVRVNGKKVGIRLTSPWRFDITKYIKPGTNILELLVYNTLSNHYTTIPTRYRGDLTSGLLGPVSIEIIK